jgi:DNA repair exonuclease SbcCD ATPase subunit
MTTFKEKAAKKEQELSQAEESLSNPSNEHEQKQQRLDSLLEEAQQQESLKNDLQKQLQLAQTPYKAASRELESLKREQTRVDKQLTAARKRLQTARDQIIEQAGAAHSEEARRTALLKKTEEDLVIAQEKVPSLRQTVTLALRSYEELEPHVLDSRNKVKKLSNQIHGVGVTIRELGSKSGDSAVVWGRNVPKVQKMVSLFRVLDTKETLFKCTHQ